MNSDVVVNYKVPRLFFAECIGDIHQSAKYLMKEEKERFGEGLSLGSTAKLSPPKQSVKFKCQIWFEITKIFAKKCLEMCLACDLIEK